MNDDLRFMAAALSFGRRGLGRTSSNPSVGAVVVRGGVVVGRGVTAEGGRPHAEPQALLEAGDAARGATLYVTLEPCSHFGATPPCVEAIMEAGIARVVCAMEDPDARVQGRGVARLRRAGIDVVVGVGGATARRDHVGHITRATFGRPAVTLKLALTADGYAAGDAHDPRLAITGEAANLCTAAMRATHDAIMVGIGTVLADDPLLTVRLPGCDARPLRVVIDSRLRLPLRSRLATTAQEFPTLVVTTPDAGADRESALIEAGIEVVRVEGDAFGRVDMFAATAYLAGRNLTRVFSEGGPRLGSHMLLEGLIDEVLIFTALRPLGRRGTSGLTDAARECLHDSERYHVMEGVKFGSDTLVRYLKA